MTRSWMVRPAIGWAFALTMLSALTSSPPAAAQFVQQGNKLIGSFTGSEPGEGKSVALSADGNTAIVGGPGEGAAWVYVRVGGVWVEQVKLTGTGSSGNSGQGYAVAISADGNTALVGGPFDNSNAGAAWVFVRNGSTWTQQTKLVGLSSSGVAEQGAAVALSADGNTALVGGPYDNTSVGAAWVFVRSNGAWSQPTSKLIGTGETGTGLFGDSVALSGDGNTAIVGGPYDNSATGAAWAFALSNGAWTQQGGKLTAGQGSGGLFGYSVALSADGNTAIAGASGDNSLVGAAWIFARTNGAWTRQAELIGSGNIGNSVQGDSVALSADAGTAMVGGTGDNSGVGAAWIFTRPEGIWRQQGKLVGAGNSGASQQGWSVALSADGTTAMVGGFNDNNIEGAAWVFVQPGWISAATHDFNGDGYSDILWRNSSSGQLAMWLMQGSTVTPGASISAVASTWSVVGSRDFNADGNADILWLDSSGDVAIWLMTGTGVISYNGLGNVGTQWSVTGTGDFNGDGSADILWRNTSTGDLAIWFMMDGQLSASADFGDVPLTWQVVGTGDFNGDGTTDILWRDTSNGDLAIWLMSGGQRASSIDLGDVALTWQVVGTGDFNGDGTADILWRDSSGDIAVWLISGGEFSSGVVLGQLPATWSVAETGDFNGDGQSDILWIDTAGDIVLWFMDGLTIHSYASLGNVGATWQVQGQNAD